MTNVLVIDNDPQTLHMLRTALAARGYHVVSAADGVTALRIAARARPDVVVLELDLPDLEGTAVIARLRGWSAVPIIVLSRHANTEDMVRALDTGADDYLSKPFGMPVFLARLRAVLRRADTTPDASANRVIDTDAFTVDLAAKKVWRDGGEVRLTPTEWALLEILIRHHGRVVPHRQLLTEVWGPDHLADTQYLRVYIAQLRRKLEPEPARPRHLITEPGQGFRFRVESAPGLGHGIRQS